MILERLMAILAPETCLGCGISGVVLCATCLDDVNLGVSGLDLITSKLDGVTVGAFYNGQVKEMVLKLKFHRLRSVAGVAAELILRRLPNDLVAEVVTSVPVSPRRYRERGYNQSELVAKIVARRLGLPYQRTLGRESSVHQMGSDRRERFAQIAGAFFPLRRLEGRRVLVVDDVVTTGATLSECASTLVKAGAKSVWGAVIARH